MKRGMLPSDGRFPPNGVVFGRFSTSCAGTRKQMADSQPSSITQHQLGASVRCPRFVTHQGKARAIPPDPWPPQSSFFPPFLQLGLPPVELTLSQLALPAKLRNRHAAPHRLPNRPLPLRACSASCFQQLIPHLHLSVQHAHPAHVSTINCAGIIGRELQPRKMGSPDGYANTE